MLQPTEALLVVLDLLASIKGFGDMRQSFGDSILDLVDLVVKTFDIRFYASDVFL